jgi:alkanesulfonate monooxygenase SsuD/methylene tetrahydromethanopterin reductase-like flavin-dependent oxidoreductase (luciferase family)
VWTICVALGAEAQRLASSGRMAFTMLRRGELIAVPPPETALEFIAREEQARTDAGKTSGQNRAQRRTVVGSPETVRTELEDVAVKYGACEVIAVNILYDHQARRRSYELLAQAFQD